MTETLMNFGRDSKSTYQNIGIDQTELIQEHHVDISKLRQRERLRLDQRNLKKYRSMITKPKVT
jgi:hypothetical protein